MLVNSKIEVGDIVDAVVEYILNFGIIVQFFDREGNQTWGVIDNTDMLVYPVVFKEGETVRAVVLGMKDTQIKLSMLEKFFSLREQWVSHRATVEIGMIVEVDECVRNHTHILLRINHGDFWGELNRPYEYNLLFHIRNALNKQNLSGRVIGFNDAACQVIIELISAV